MKHRAEIRAALRAPGLTAALFPLSATHWDGEDFDPVDGESVREQFRPVSQVLVELPADGGTLEAGGLYLLTHSAPTPRDGSTPVRSAAGDAFAGAAVTAYPPGSQIVQGVGDDRVVVTIWSTDSAGGLPNGDRWETPVTIRWTAETVNRL